MSLEDFIRIHRNFLLEQQSLFNRHLDELNALETSISGIDLPRNSSAEVTSSSGLVTSKGSSSKRSKRLTSEEKELLKEEKKKIRSERGKRKKEVDPNKPKRPATAFFLYSTDELPKLREKLKGQGISHIDMMVKLGAMWTALPTEQKQKYLQRGEIDRVEYSRKMELYKNSKENEKSASPRERSDSIADDRVHAAQRVLAPILQSLQDERIPVTESEKKKKKKRRQEEAAETFDMDDNYDRVVESEDFGDEGERKKKKKRKSKHHRHHSSAESD